MILWYNNIQIDKSLVELSNNFIESDEFFYKELNIYTSYYSLKGIDELTNVYSLIIDTLMKDLSLHHRSKYEWNYWIQKYTNKLDGHLVHDHFDFKTILSWVHFIQVPENQKCFYFLDSNKNKLYPENQSFGDFIVFPSWSLHGVDKVIQENSNRVIVAGNIILHSIESGSKTWNFEDRTVH